MNSDCLIIIPTHSSYRDICVLFLELINKNWDKCSYRIVISVVGENVAFNGYETVYNGNDASLPTCIYNVVKKYDFPLYMCFLGDSLIYRKICEKKVEELIEFLIGNSVEYCSLIPMKPRENQRCFNRMVRNIHYVDRYNHNFEAFICNKTFVEKEFCDDISDYDFELKYLRLAKESTSEGYFKDRYIVNYNIMQIISSIRKGKWDRCALHKIMKYNPEFDYSCRMQNSKIEQIIFIMRCLLEPILPTKIRIGIKKVMTKLFHIKFETMF